MAQGSVAETFQIYRGRLLKFIRARVRRLEDAEDILQELFYQLLRLNNLASPVEQAAAWLYRAARNKIIDWYRKKKDLPLPAPADTDDGYGDGLPDIAGLISSDGAEPETEMLRKLLWEEIESALKELPEAQRDVFVQTEFLGLPVKELAEKTGVPLNTVLSRKHYAVVYLRKRLKDLYADVMGC